MDDASAIFWNPAALAFMKGQEVSITHANWLPQFQLPDLFYDYLNYRQDIDAIGGTIGASVTYLSLGEFSVTNSSGPHGHRQVQVVRVCRHGRICHEGV